MGGIVERLRGLLGGGGGDVTDITQEASAADRELAADDVAATRENAPPDSPSDAPSATTDLPGPVEE